MVQGFTWVHGVPPLLNSMMRKLFHNTMPFLREVRSSVPGTDDLPPGWGCIYNDGANCRIYVNVEGTIKYVDMT